MWTAWCDISKPGGANWCQQAIYRSSAADGRSRHCCRGWGKRRWFYILVENKNTPKKYLSVNMYFNAKIRIRGVYGCGQKYLNLWRLITTYITKDKALRCHNMGNVLTIYASHAWFSFISFSLFSFFQRLSLATCS